MAVRAPIRSRRLAVRAPSASRQECQWTDSLLVSIRIWTVWNSSSSCGRTFRLVSFTTFNFISTRKELVQCILNRLSDYLPRGRAKQLLQFWKRCGFFVSQMKWTNHRRSLLSSHPISLKQITAGKYVWACQDWFYMWCSFAEKLARGFSSSHQALWRKTKKL